MTIVQPPIATVPPSFIMATAEKYLLGFDTTQALINAGTGGPPSSPVVTMTDIGTGAVISLASPTIVGNIIKQEVLGSALTAKHKYTLSVVFTIDADNAALMVLTITIPQ